MRLLSRFSTVERERRLLLAFEALGEADAFRLARQAKIVGPLVFSILERWQREGVITARWQEWWEKPVADDGSRLPARRLYRLAEGTDF